jgi:hypothetical protein
MMDPTLALLVYAAITIGSAVLWHRYVPIYLVAALGATVTTIVLFLFVDYLQSGHVTTRMEIALILTGIPAAIVSLLVGLPYRAKRKAGGDGRAR